MAKHLREHTDIHAEGKPKRDEGKKQETSLQGAFASVMLLGLFLLLTWAGVFVLFLIRG